MASRNIANIQREDYQKSHKKKGGASSSVSFEPKPSYYSLSVDETDTEDGIQDEEEEVDTAQEQTSWWRWWIENPKIRKFLRVFSLVNLVILALSIPFYNLVDLEDSQRKTIQIQFSVITCFDFLLSCLYTINLVLELQYHFHIRKPFERALSPEQKEQTKGYTDCLRLSSIVGITLSLWWSVAIGVYRSINIEIFWALYIGLIPRAILSIVSVIRLLLPLKVDSSALREVSKLLKWKQLGMVTMFYFVFVFLFALIGVHTIGGLDYICLYNKTFEDGNWTTVPAIPIIHCNPNTDRRQRFCGRNSIETDLICSTYPSDNPEDGIYFQYRSEVYYGQFRVILDALYAVYEASTLELWSFMMYTAIDGSEPLLAILFYFALVLFIVIILQQSIFLVVIIESFAELRSHSSLWSKEIGSQKTQDKPLTVLSLQSGSESKLHLKTLEERGSVEFINKYCSFLIKLEKFFLLLVLLDAIITATKFADIPEMAQSPMKITLQVWQVTVSVAFMVEIIFLFVFHLYHGQWRLFFRRPYYLCLIVLAIGGMIASIPNDHIYNPLLPGNGLAIFQALRFPRLLRLFDNLLNFFLRLMGNLRIPILSLITIVIICWLAVINAQIFGYETDFPAGCERVAGQQFGSFMDAFVSTFQLVLNEAWTDVISEVMCRRTEWFVTNLYFIVVHLFSSLIFLNFFGAVILDNLEYDEKKKKRKLEEIKQKEAVFAETIPRHLKIFKKFGNQPRKLRPPPGSGIEDPNLEEVEVRRFFDTANTSDLVEDLKSPEYTLPPSMHTQQPERFENQLRQLSLVSTESFDLIPTNTPVLHGKYLSVSAILNYIKLWRQYTEEEKIKNPHSSHIHYLFGQSPYERRNSENSHSKQVPSEYETYREKHRFFDMALFCMPPENKIRKCCTWILTKQAQAPRYVLIETKGRVLHIFKLRIMFVFQWIISRLSYFTWIMFIGLWAVIISQMIEFSSHTSSIDPNFIYILPVEIFYFILMFTWLILRVLSRGCFLNPHAAINSPWDILDWILVLNCTFLFILLPLWFDDDINSAVLQLNLPYLPDWTKWMFIIRNLRPLHSISILSSLRAVIREISEGWRNLLKATIIMFGFVFMFASLGVQLFAGTEINPLSYCNDPTISTMEKCVGEFRIRLEISREFLPMFTNSTDDITMLVPRVWFPFARDFPFSNVLYAFVTLFELLTLEGWPEVRELFVAKSTKEDAYMFLYIHTYVFFAVNLGLQLFLGIVVNNFNEHKPGHTFLLSLEQNRWSELMQRVSLQRPIKLPPEPRDNYLRMWLYRMLTHHKYRWVPTVIITLSALTLIVPWEIKLITTAGVHTLVVFSIVFNIYTIIEMVLKLLAFGPAYFQSWRNLFDSILALFTVGYVLFAVLVLSIPEFETYKKLSYVALILAVLKLLTILVKYSAMLNLLLTVVSTLVRSVSLIAVLFIVIICYSLVGVTLFNNVRSGEAIDFNLVNFQGFVQASSAIWRSLTGEDWYQIMWDAAVSEPYCNESLKNCGCAVLSVLYFSTFIIIVPFIMLNVFIAVLLENFSIFYNDENTNLDLPAMKDFKKKWRHFDKSARGHIPAIRVKLLLRSLELQQYYSYTPVDQGYKRERVVYELTEEPLLLWEMEKELHQEISAHTNKTTPTEYQGQGHSLQEESSVSAEARFQFYNVLKMLAYRCEDIYIRLEPHELFTREELETNIQIDVAEDCILSWLQKWVKPLVRKQRELQSSSGDDQQETQQTQPTAKDRRHQLFSLHNVQSQLLNVQSWGKQHSMETEDEEGIPEGQKRLSWNTQLASTSEEQIDGMDLESSFVTRSFNKLQQNMSPGILERQEKAREWFKMQEEWMDKIQEDPNYFDDHL